MMTAPVPKKMTTARSAGPIPTPTRKPTNLYRRADIEDVVSAHILAAEHASAIGFRKYVISATSTAWRYGALAHTGFEKT